MLDVSVIYQKENVENFYFNSWVKVNKQLKCSLRAWLLKSNKNGARAK